MPNIFSGQKLKEIKEKQLRIFTVFALGCQASAWISGYSI